MVHSSHFLYVVFTFKMQPKRTFFPELTGIIKRKKTYESTIDLWSEVKYYTVAVFSVLSHPLFKRKRTVERRSGNKMCGEIFEIGQRGY